MATHLIVIPGFGMRGRDMELVEGPEGNCKKFDHLRVLDPNWSGSQSLSEVAEQLALEINDIYQAAAVEPPAQRSFVVYGFSLGGDLLMEMVNRNLLNLGSDSALILADPNVNGLTCFVTRLAKLSASRAEFLAAVSAHANGLGVMQQANWFKYQAAVDANISLAEWVNFQLIAESVLTSVDKRYADFVATVALERASLKGARIKLLFSVSSNRALKIAGAHLFAGEEDWFECPEKMLHFGLSDQGEICRQAERALLSLKRLSSTRAGG